MSKNFDEVCDYLERMEQMVHPRCVSFENLDKAFPQMPIEVNKIIHEYMKHPFEMKIEYAAVRRQFTKLTVHGCQVPSHYQYSMFEREYQERVQREFEQEREWRYHEAMIEIGWEDWEELWWAEHE